jgi:hypothetical protein
MISAMMSFLEPPRIAEVGRYASETGRRLPAGKFDDTADLTILRAMGKQTILLLSLIAAMVTACGLLSDDEGEASPVATALVETPEAAPSLPGTPGAVAPVAVTQSSDTLRVWLPPEISSVDSSAAGALMAQIVTYGETHPELAAQVELKQVAGPGGILSYLRTGRVVAPGVLPHLIALPAEQLASASAEGLIFSLDGLIEAALLDDLYPAARSLSELSGVTLGYPFVLTGLSHLAHSSAITTTLPVVWDELSALNQGQLVFPAASREGAILALQFYLDLGGTLTNDAGQPALQVEILAQALDAFSRARGSNFIALQSSNVRGLDETWRLFQSGVVAMTLTTSGQFLRERTAESPSGYGAVSGPLGALNPLVTGWAWAITTSDPVQKRRAANLLSALILEPEFDAWTQQNFLLPARRQTMEAWPADDAYVNFLRQQLEQAQANPLTSGGTITTALSNALFDVVSLARSPRAAAEAAVLAVQP